MSKYSMPDGTIVDTKNATKTWGEDTRWNGNNHISVATGSQWDHQELHRSRKGRYWLECTSQWQGSTDHAEWLSPEAATKWLLAQGHDLPKDLAHLEDTVSE